MSDELLERLDREMSTWALCLDAAARIRELEAQLEASQQVACQTTKTHATTMGELIAERKAREELLRLAKRLSSDYSEDAEQYFESMKALRAYIEKEKAK